MSLRPGLACTMLAALTLHLSAAARADDASAPPAAQSASNNGAEGSTWPHRIDTAARVSDAHLVLDVKVTDAKGREGERTIEVWQKGDEHRLVRMVAPARLRGVGLLAGPDHSLHLFLPQYPPARRVVGNKRADAFMGTDFAVEDLSRMTYSADYSASVVGVEDGLTHLQLTPYATTGEQTVELWVGDDAVVRRIRHTDARGRASRQLDLSDVRPEGDVLLAHKMVVVDLLRDRRTEATVREVTLDQALSDELFTVTNLERP